MCEDFVVCVGCVTVRFVSRRVRLYACAWALALRSRGGAAKIFGVEAMERLSRMSGIFMSAQRYPQATGHMRMRLECHMRSPPLSSTAAIVILLRLTLTRCSLHTTHTHTHDLEGSRRDPPAGRCTAAWRGSLVLRSLL